MLLVLYAGTVYECLCLSITIWQIKLGRHQGSTALIIMLGCRVAWTKRQSLIVVLAYMNTLPKTNPWLALTSRNAYLLAGNLSGHDGSTSSLLGCGSLTIWEICYTRLIHRYLILQWKSTRWVILMPLCRVVLCPGSQPFITSVTNTLLYGLQHAVLAVAANCYNSAMCLVTKVSLRW